MTLTSDVSTHVRDEIPRRDGPRSGDLPLARSRTRASHTHHGQHCWCLTPWVTTFNLCARANGNVGEFLEQPPAASVSLSVITAQLLQIQRNCDARLQKQTWARLTSRRDCPPDSQGLTSNHRALTSFSQPPRGLPSAAQNILQQLGNPVPSVMRVCGWPFPRLSRYDEWSRLSGHGDPTRDDTGWWDITDVTGRRLGPDSDIRHGTPRDTCGGGRRKNGKRKGGWGA
ncbi:hypothetical protein RRG08_030945 [Elysia crispata]|uniref:Uncharacterized protein n=1 Tax=Elysia crispata TaxID=231223 RepID=A0AAE1DV66_9GAST|nr:hypothetical protein RRG08_030945 [Elysia crispata]